MSIEKAYNFKRINELVSSSGTIKHIDISSMAEEDYDLVINLLPNDNEHARKNEQQEFKTLGIEYKYIPVDWNNPKQSDYIEFESILNGFKCKKIHIHCAANFRATAFYGIYTCKNLDWSKLQSFELMKSFWDISEYPLWEQLITKLIET